MDAKEAVKRAKAFVADILAEEQPANIGLEEIKKSGNSWLVTLGFSRPWDAASMFAPNARRPRSFRVITVRDSDGEIEQMAQRADSER